jgi:hypothetical protein
MLEGGGRLVKKGSRVRRSLSWRKMSEARGKKRKRFGREWGGSSQSV